MRGLDYSPMVQISLEMTHTGEPTIPEACVSLSVKEYKSKKLLARNVLFS
jgi:hypothetical protein